MFIVRYFCKGVNCWTAIFLHRKFVLYFRDNSRGQVTSIEMKIGKLDLCYYNSDRLHYKIVETMLFKSSGFILRHFV